MKTSEILEKALDHLWDGTNPDEDGDPTDDSSKYMCDCVQSLCVCDVISWDTYRKIQARVIYPSIKEWGYFEDYLRHEIKLDVDSMLYTEIQELRGQHMLELIKQAKEKEAKEVAA